MHVFFSFLHVVLFVILLEVEAKDTEMTQTDKEWESTKGDNSSINTQSDDNNHISTETSETNTDHIHSDNSESLTKLDNSDISNVDIQESPEKNYHSKKIVTSTPVPKNRTRYDSLDEPEYEEDKIFGKFFLFWHQYLIHVHKDLYKLLTWVLMISTLGTEIFYDLYYAEIEIIMNFLSFFTHTPIENFEIIYGE